MPETFVPFGDAAGAAAVAPSIDDATREQVVAMYVAGQKTADITAQTGVGRSSIYFILRQAHIKPNRLRREEHMTSGNNDSGKHGELPTPEQAPHLLSWALDRVAFLEEELGDARDQIVRTEERLRLARAALAPEQEPSA